MSDRSAPRTIPARPVRQAASGGAALLRSLAPLLADWLPRQRWFAGKGRPISGFSLVSGTELLPCVTGGAAPGLLHVLVRAHQPGDDGDCDACYQLLLGVRSVLPPRLAHSLIGRPADGPLRDRAVYEALDDPRLAALLLERLRAPGRLGALRFAREPATAIPSGLRPRPLAADQSNSSVIYGDTYILKIFRRVSPGSNPDLELPLALARAGCSRVPAPAAWFEAVTPRFPQIPERTGAPEELSGMPATRGASPGPGTQQRLTLGVLQPFLSDACDGWQLALRALATHSDFTGPARALGRATAEVHTALARALPTTELRRPHVERLASAMTERLDAAAMAVPALRPYRAELRTAYDALATLGRRGHTWSAQRVHGDLHLGQALLSRADGRWSLIDFEGEPARPLAERRDPHPVARDIAGMLRSFDYAACQQLDSGRNRSRALANRAAYCAGYAEAGGADPRQDPELLRAYETDKAVYEVVYEAQHRPTWVTIPLSAIRRLAAAPAGGAP